MRRNAQIAGTYTHLSYQHPFAVNMKAPVISLLASVALASVATATPTVYFIRHGEKPSSGNGLSAQGLQRAQCLKTVFGASSQYNIGHIMAQTPQSDGSQSRPYNTVLPLAQSIGLTVDTSCQRDDSSCVNKVVKSLSASTKNILIW